MSISIVNLYSFSKKKKEEVNLYQMVIQQCFDISK